MTWKERREKEREKGKNNTKEAKEKAGRYVVIPGGNRKLDPNDSSIHKEYVYNVWFPRINKSFRVKREESQSGGYCVWLAAALLVNIQNKQDAQLMLDYLNKNKDNMKYMLLSRVRNFNATYPKLTQLIPEVTENFETKILKHKQNENIFDYLESVSFGYYVCLLEDMNGNKSHCVGIDCNHDPSLIYDSTHSYALELTKDNMDLCVDFETVFTKIVHCVEIRRKMTKKKIA